MKNIIDQVTIVAIIVPLAAFSYVKRGVDAIDAKILKSFSG